mmetsp:Transcript_69644/g.167137  ORF Transcript_69644/g.167137 Transcript_69644/m.167137 type:complete len:219 (-) Transcript_69644:1100-1756(-)
MQSVRRAPTPIFSKSCLVKVGLKAFPGFTALTGGAPFSATPAAAGGAATGLLELLSLLPLRLRLLLLERRRLLFFFFRCFPLSDDSLLLLAAGELSRLLESSRTGLGLGLRSQSPAAHRSYPFVKLGHPSCNADLSCTLSFGSCFIMTSTSFVPVRFAMAKMEDIISRSLAFLRKTCCCDGHGSMAISDEEAVASSRSCSDVNCKALRICSRMKNPQS